MKASTVRALGLGLFMCLCALPLAAAPNSGKITGVVVDANGTPQMGATVVVSPEQLRTGTTLELLTNDLGHFAATALPPGSYSIKVTLAGFLPSVEQHVSVSDQHTTLLEIVLGSVFSSLDKLRRQPDDQVASDEWIWVLRSSASTRPVLRWADVEVIVAGMPNPMENGQRQTLNRARLELTAGAEHPGSVSNVADSPGTAFAYDWGLGSHGDLLMAGQISYEGTSPAGGFATEWVPSGEIGVGPVTSLLLRESRLGPDGPTFRGVRMSHDNQFALGDRISVRYGSELLMAGLGTMTFAVRPRAEIAFQLKPGWQASILVATHPWQDGMGSETALQSAMNTLDAFPTLLVRNGRPVLENNLHEEILVEHALNNKATVDAAVFHDRSTHTAVFGLGNVSGSDYLQDFFSDVFAYDAGVSSSTGARLAYRQKFTDNLETTIVYAYAGALVPYEDPSEAALRDQLVTRYRHSLAARVSASIPRFGTRVSTSYKWVNGQAVSHQDSYGESLYHLDPFLSMEIRQSLPSFLPFHMEASADIGNILAQGYIPVATGDGQVILVPSYRYIRGGVSFQF